jgi:Right handed beta helix region
MSYTVIGRDYAASDAGLRAALAAGHRWLVFEADVWLGAPLDLSHYAAPHALRLEGAGGRLTSIARGFAGDALIKQSTTGSDVWRLYASGMLFSGERATFSGGANLLLFRANDCFFEDCTFRNSPTHGIEIRTSAPSRFAFVACRWDHNFGSGLFIEGHTGFTATGGAVRNNAGNGRSIRSTSPNPADIQGVHFASNDTGTGNDGARVYEGRCHAFRNCRFTDDDLQLDAGAQTCIAENNMVTFNGVINDQGTGNIVQLNVDA